MKRGRLILALVLTLSIVTAVLQYTSHRSEPMGSDEAAWIFSSVFWTRLVSGEMLHPEWQSADAIDHPPLGKYYYGFFLWLRGMNEGDIANKEWWLSVSGDLARQREFLAGMTERISREKLLCARAAAAGTMVALVMAMYALGGVLGGRRLGLLAAVATCLCDLSAHVAPYVLIDTIFTAILAAQTAALLAWLKRSVAGDRAWQPAAVAGALTGLLLLTKMNGAIQLGTLCVAASCALLLSEGRRREVVAQALSIAISALAIAFLLNPALLLAPSAVIHMAKWRSLQLEFQGQVLGTDFLPLLDSVSFAFRTLFAGYGISRRAWFFPSIEFLLTVAGAVRALSLIVAPRERWQRPAALVLLSAAAFWIAPTLYSYKFTLFSRYLMPLLPWVLILEAAGAAVVIDFLTGFFRGWADAPDLFAGARQWLLAALFAVIAWQALAGDRALESYRAYLSRPAFLTRHLGQILATDPQNVEARILLARQHIGMEDDAGALKLIESVAADKPTDREVRALHLVLRERVSGKER